MWIRPIDDADRDWVSRVIADQWGLPVVSISGYHDPSQLDGLVAGDNSERLGLLTYRFTDDGCEVVTLNSLWEGRGIGGFLLDTAHRDVAVPRGVRLWLITTNDNIRAIAFYQRRGMDLIRLHRDFADAVALHKELPAPSPIGIPFRHALEFEFPAPSG